MAARVDGTGGSSGSGSAVGGGAAVGAAAAAAAVGSAAHVPPLVIGPQHLVAGHAKAHGYVDGVGAAARFDWITGLAADAAGNCFAAEAGNNKRVRKITANGVVTTLSKGAADAPFWEPNGLAVSPDQSYLLATDYIKQRVYRIAVSNGDTAVVRSGLEHPWGVAFDFALGEWLIRCQFGRLHLLALTPDGAARLRTVQPLQITTAQRTSAALGIVSPTETLLRTATDAAERVFAIEHIGSEWRLLRFDAVSGDANAGIDRARAVAVAVANFELSYVAVGNGCVFVSSTTAIYRIPIDDKCVPKTRVSALDTAPRLHVLNRLRTVNLRNANLSDADVSGAAFVDAFAHLHALTALDLSSNRLTQLPLHLVADKRALTELDVSHNQLRTLPWGIAVLHDRVKELDLASNPFDLLPAELRSFQPGRQWGEDWVQVYHREMYELLRFCADVQSGAALGTGDRLKRCKVVTIGHAAAGKTTLLNAWKSDTKSDRKTQTQTQTELSREPVRVPTCEVLHSHVSRDGINWSAFDFPGTALC